MPRGLYTGPRVAVARGRGGLLRSWLMGQACSWGAGRSQGLGGAESSTWKMRVEFSGEFLEGTREMRN